MNIEPLLKRAFNARQPLFDLETDNCFRLFNTDGDGLEGLTIDLYGEYILIQYFKPELSDTAITISVTLEKLLNEYGVYVKGVLIKNRCRNINMKNPAEAFKSFKALGSLPPDEYTVLNNGVTVSVDLIQGQNTGIFFDMRDIRNAVAPYYPSGGTMLNLFSYTGIFSIHGLKNGMRSALNVDISGSVLKKARRNYELNSLNPDSRDFIKDDSIKKLKLFAKKGVNFDFAVFDPPSFARNKKASFSAANDYPEALQLLSLICSGGYVLTSINSHSITKKEYLEAHPGPWKLERLMHEAVDFPYKQKPYLKAGLWRVNR